MLRNKTALITGSNRGIGRAMVEIFAQKGAHIIAHARKETEDFIEFVKKTETSCNTTIDMVFFDLRDTLSMRNELKKFVLGKNNIDILVNNAGVGHGVSFLRTPVSQIKEVYDINLFSAMEITQIVLRKMCLQKSGSIINITSVSGIDLSAGNSAYGTAKAALAAWTKTLAAELGAFNIRVNAIAPGLIETSMGKSVKDFVEKRMIEECALKRKGSPYEIAEIAAFLASDNSSFINGMEIIANGGKI